MASVIIIGPSGRERRALSANNSFGRHPDNTHQLMDRVVSKKHCYIEERKGRYLVRDADSLNGTFLNGRRIKESFLEHGDEVVIGSTRLLFEADAQGSRVDLSDFASDSATMKGAVDASKVTILREVQDRRIDVKVDAAKGHVFLPVDLIHEKEDLSADYERLRASYEVTRAIGTERDIDLLLRKLLDTAFSLLSADRGVVLLYDATRETLEPRCARGQDLDEAQELTLSQTIIDEVLRDKAGVLSNDALADERFQSAHSVILQGIRSTLAVPLMHSNRILGVMLLDSLNAANVFTQKDLELLQTVAHQAALAIQNRLLAKELEQEAITRERFERLLSPAIAEQVISGEVEVAKGGELRETTILFTDIRNFTAMTESYAAEQIVEMLNEYFELMVEIVFRYEGTLDKLVGDEIMALFGAPVAHEDDPIRAVKAALEMQQVLKIFNQVRAQKALPALEVGIGINTGEVVAGYLGSSRALEYTVVGDPVNTGARLCSIAKSGQILVSETTQRLVADVFELIELPATKVKGKARPIRIFQVIRALKER